MVHASGQSWRLGRCTSLVGGVLLLAAFATALPSGLAKDPKDDAPAKPEAAKTEKGDKGDAKALPLPKAPEPPRLTIVAKTPDVAEMVKVINEKLEATWAANKVVPTRYVDDYEYVRRASLDIIGRVAKPAEIQQFLKDPKETRRGLLVERLLASEDYARHWAHVWTNWLLSRSGVFGRQGMYHEQTNVWLEDQFAQNRPYHLIVKDLLTASGDNTKNGAVNFILAHVGEAVPPAKRAEEGQFEMVPITSRITRLFLGTQVQCAQCHDHPFHKSIKQDRFWGVNAFLRQVERVGNPPAERGRMMAYTKLELRDNDKWNNDATVFYEKRNGVVLQTGAEFIAPAEGKKPSRLPAGVAGKERREKLAEYIQDHENFPKAVVNRMWAAFFGRGFVNPIDDFNDQNQPSDPELFNELATRFKHYNYDMKKLIRWICNSNAYQLSYVANRTNDKQEHEALFSRMIMKAMSPEQLFESLMVATNAEAAETKDGKRVLRDQWMNWLIANFGDDEGNEVNFNGTVVQALLMMNGEDINAAINRKDKGTVAMALAKGKGAPGAVIRELYLASLNRPPTETEVKTILSKIKLRPGFNEKDAAAPYCDVFWALLNSAEFLLNH